MNGITIKDGYVELTSPIVLYSGGGYDPNNCLDKFKYIGQGKTLSDGKVLYLSTSEVDAYAYALPHNGVIKKYIIKDKLKLVDITEGMMHYNYNELDSFCHDDYDGYFLKWSNNSIEIALCNCSKHLVYVGCKTIRDYHSGNDYKYKCLENIEICEPHTLSRKKSRNSKKSKSKKGKTIKKSHSRRIIKK